MSKADPYIPPRSTAPNYTRRYVLFLCIAGFGCLVDLLSKHYVFAWLGIPTGERNIHWIVEDYVGIETALNFGALFGMGQNKVWFFATMSFVALGGIGFWLTQYQAIQDRLLTVVLAVVTGGILGNLYDRLGLWSNFQIFAVRDWIRFSYQEHVWPNFNIADSLLVCGAALLFWHSLKNPQPEVARDDSSLAEAA